MNPKTKLNGLIAELKGLAPKVEAQDEEAMTRAEELTQKEIPAAKEAVKQFERSRALGASIKSLGIAAGAGDGDDGSGDDGSGSKGGTLGQMVASALAKTGQGKGEKVTIVSSERKDDPATATYNANPTGDYERTTIEYRDQILTGPRRPLTVAALFSQETTEAKAVTYYVEGAATGAPTTIAEGGKYPTLTFGEPAAHTDALKKIGALWKDTDELLDDSQRLAQSIDNRADYLMDITEEDQLLSGNGSGNNITGLLNRSGIQTATATDMDAALLAIKHAKTGIRKNTPGFRADGLLINDEDWDAITDLMDKNGQFRVGGPFSFGPYGNGGYLEEPPLWALRVVPTQAIPKGTMVIGAFRLGGSVIRNGGRRVEMTNSDSDDFDNGLVAFRTTERVALAIRYPAAFVKLTVG